ncbi:ArsR family transcriptional regulator [Micromonospora endolithica]|uniref:ArsR family transcriptional regulator n=1 Tax=Micromonospora endolithica TaxID=230091 RepID=A0A3A9ZNQ0_9ACTN|nr:ArsR family transcriptional regulator [Micromonospora endolithica]
MEERLSALEAQVAALTGRETAVGSVAAPDADVYWALQGLKERLPDVSTGALLYTGTVQIADQRLDWQYGHTIDEVLGDDWTALAGTLSALAHPVRLRLLREVLGGRHGTAELAAIEGLGTTGQLHHHLRQLAAAGWLRSAGRGRWTVPGERVVPLLVILAAARR